MPEAYPIEVYFYTGFDKANVPAEASILDGAVKKSYDAVFMFQSRNLSTIRLKAEWSEIKDANYVKLSPTNGDLPVYYVVTGVVMKSAMTAELSLLTDPLLSCGGLSKISVLGGWCSRAHAGLSGDGLFANIIDEPWSPSNQLRIVDDPVLIHDTTSEDIMTMVGATIDLYDMLDYSSTVLSTGDEALPSVTIPTLKTLDSKHYTTLSMLDHSYKLPGIGIWWMGITSPNNFIPQAIAATRQIGVDSALTSAYVLGREDIDFVTYEPTGSDPVEKNYPYVSITGKTRIYPSKLPYAYATVKNKKVFAVFNVYTIISSASGNSAEFKAEELYSGGSEPNLRVVIDPAPSGTAYCQPTYYEGKPVQRLEHAIAGLPWLNAGMQMEGASGAGLITVNAQRKNSQVKMNAIYQQESANQQAMTDTAQNLLGGVTSAFGAVTSPTPSGLMGGIAGVIGGAINQENITEQFRIGTESRVENTRWTMGDNKFSSNVASAVVAPEIKFPVSVNNAAYFGNSFIIYHVGLSVNDIKRLDDFFTAYGYAQDKPMDKALMQNRTKFNYIKTSGAHYMAATVSPSMLQALEDMTDAGVRIWHELPNAAAYDNNPPKEGT